MAHRISHSSCVVLGAGVIVDVVVGSWVVKWWFRWWGCSVWSVWGWVVCSLWVRDIINAGNCRRKRNSKEMPWKETKLYELPWFFYPSSNFSITSPFVIDRKPIVFKVWKGQIVLRSRWNWALNVFQPLVLSYNILPKIF